MAKWNAEDYKKNSANQYTWATELLGRAGIRANDDILDIGCGDGRVTAAIALKAIGGTVLGIDSSAEMIRSASGSFPARKYKNLKFAVSNAENIEGRNIYDLIFSSACLHWVKDQTKVLKRAERALKPGGRIFFQMGGRGNASGIFKTLSVLKKRSKWAPYFRGFDNPYFFAGIGEYYALLKNAGLKVVSVKLIPKTAEYDGVEGFKGWIRTTWMPYTNRVPVLMREDFINEAAITYINRFRHAENGKVLMDMQRLQAEAVKPRKTHENQG
jgi:trans-aconitate methyltransferase